MPRPRDQQGSAGAPEATRCQRAACAALGLVFALSCGEATPPPPSLVLITTSALRADKLPCYGGDGAGGGGGAICALADRGALFVWAFTTTPAVAPSAASLLTSQIPREHGVEVSAASFLRTGSITLAAALRARGYATAAFVAAPELNRSRNLQVGFDRYETGESESLARSAERIAEQASAWIRTAHSYETPFFAWVHFPATSIESAPPLRGVGLRELDGYVRSLIDAALAPGAGEDAIAPGIAFAALTGSEAQSRARPLDIERVRVPLLWSPPGGVVPQRLLAPIPLLDVAPTLLDSVGGVVPESFVGERLHVGALPPAAPGPARPLELEGGDETGIVLSRRFYAKRRGDVLARTALLSNSGALPEIRAVSPRSSIVAEHEQLLAEAALRDIARSPAEPPLRPSPTSSASPASIGADRNALSPAAE